jgi:Protein of unknown function (DUF2523)
MGAFFTALLAKFSAVLTWWGKLFVAVFVALWDFIRDAAVWPFEQLLGIVETTLQGINTQGLTGHLGVWGSLPAELLNVLGLLGVGTAISIISAAIAVRLLLQLIPFTRLGS